MIFTRHFGALAARPDFNDHSVEPELELQQEIDELLQSEAHDDSAGTRAS